MHYIKRLRRIPLSDILTKIITRFINSLGFSYHMLRTVNTSSVEALWMVNQFSHQPAIATANVQETEFFLISYYFVFFFFMVSLVCSIAGFSISFDI